MNTTQNYKDFIASKALKTLQMGIDITNLTINPKLFGHQQYIVKKALQRGRCAVFASTGLGKTVMELEFAHHVANHTGKPVLILTPLCVASQMHDEGLRFGYDTQVAKEQSEVVKPIVITNYEKLHHFDANEFGGIVLDEASILKGHNGEYRKMITEFAANIHFRMTASATPSPNDHMELGTQCEFLGVLTRTEMLATFFTHDGGETSKWRLKGHGRSEFWKWLNTWAIAVRKPSDLGFDDTGYDLKPLNIHEITVQAPNEGLDTLFAMDAQSLTERRKAKKDTLEDRIKVCADLVNNSDEQWLVWCNLNSESEMLRKAIPDAIEVTGAHNEQYKQSAIDAFINYGRQDLWDGNQSMKKSANNEPHPTQNTEQSETLNLVQTKKQGKNTIASGMKQTKNMLQNTEKNTENGTGLPLNSGIQCLNLNHTAVPFAQDQLKKTQEKLNQQNDCMLIIATQQESLEDYSVAHVTSELESLEMTQNYSEEQPNISKRKGRVIISKSSIFGFGLNLQNCHNMAFVGLSDSFEQTYQAIKRCHRFGQAEEVNVYMISANTEGNIKTNIQRKQIQHNTMYDEMIASMKEFGDDSQTDLIDTSYSTDTVTGENFELHLGDCVQEIKKLADNSVDYSIFSPPFASLYTFSASDCDMSNCKSYQDFIAHFKFLAKELFRVIKSGRLISFHCMNLTLSKASNGFMGIKDFRGDLIRIFEEVGFVQHSEVVIWKDPVIAMQRTKAIGLLHKQVMKDSTVSRQALPDYLITMGKRGINQEPVSGLLDYYVGTSDPTSGDDDYRNSINIWSKYASPVWMDINPSDTLQREGAKENDDERHISLLQLQVIHRALQLWTNPGDLVLSPFAGIGSEGYEALKMNRRYVGFELKKSYFNMAVKNLKAVENAPQQMNLLELA